MIQQTKKERKKRAEVRRIVDRFCRKFAQHEVLEAIEQDDTVGTRTLPSESSVALLASIFVRGRVEVAGMRLREGDPSWN